LFSSALVSLFASKILPKKTNQMTQKLRWKGGTWIAEETVRFWW